MWLIRRPLFDLKCPSKEIVLQFIRVFGIVGCFLVVIKHIS